MFQVHGLGSASESISVIIMSEQKMSGIGITSHLARARLLLFILMIPFCAGCQSFRSEYFPDHEANHNEGQREIDSFFFKPGTVF